MVGSKDITGGNMFGLTNYYKVPQKEFLESERCVRYINKKRYTYKESCMGTIVERIGYTRDKIEGCECLGENFSTQTVYCYKYNKVIKDFMEVNSYGLDLIKCCDCLTLKLNRGKNKGGRNERDKC